MSAVTVLGQRLVRGLAAENAAVRQLLGLCPLLAVSHTAVNAIGLAGASLFVLIGANGLIAACGRWIPREARLPAFMLIIGAFTTVAVRVLEAFSFELYLTIALFLQIIVTNCIILAQAERSASRLPVRAALVEATATGLGFAVVLITLGAVREVVGHGTLFAGLDTLFGPGAAAWRIDFADRGVGIAVLPPGAFLIFGLMLAVRRGRSP